MKKLLAILLVLTMVLSLSACGEEPEVPEEEVQPEVQETIVDANGDEIEKPESVERISITCNGGAIQEVSVLHQNEKVVSQPSIKQFKMLSHMYDYLNDTKDVGSFNEVNIEALLALHPDIVFVGKHTPKMNDSIAEVGLKTFNLYCGKGTLETQREEFKNVGMVLGAEEEAETLINYWNEKIAMLEDLLKDIPEAERKSVYYVGKDITSAKNGPWDKSFIELVNADYAIKDIPSGSEISVEQVISINPDVIIKQQNDMDLSVITGDERIASLAAVKNGEVYQVPIGAFWWDRPSPESPLGFMWLAKTVYPEYTESIDLEKETKYFFHEFYNYDLTTEEYQSFF